MTHLTRSQLDDMLHGLRAKAARIARDYPAGDQADAIAGEAEAIEHQVAANDAEYFHDEVAAIMREVGAVEPEDSHE